MIWKKYLKKLFLVGALDDALADDDAAAELVDVLALRVHAIDGRLDDALFLSGRLVVIFFPHNFPPFDRLYS